MAQPQQYQDPILKKYADLINSKAPGVFKQTYYGDPIRIPTSTLPVLILAKLSTRVENHNNVEDMHHLRISVTVVADVRDTISEDKTMVSGTNALYDLMEGRTDGTYLLKETSVLNILRHNVELDDAHDLRTDLDSMTNVDYGMTMGKRKQDAWSLEATLELTATFPQVR